MYQKVVLTTYVNFITGCSKLGPSNSYCSRADNNGTSTVGTFVRFYEIESDLEIKVEIYSMCFTGASVELSIVIGHFNNSHS